MDLIYLFVYQMLKVGFEGVVLEASRKLRGIAEANLLLKDQDDEVERHEDSGKKDVSFLE
jgi:hypothetical protein